MTTVSCSVCKRPNDYNGSAYQRCEHCNQFFEVNRTFLSPSDPLDLLPPVFTLFDLDSAMFLDEKMLFVSPDEAYIYKGKNDLKAKMQGVINSLANDEEEAILKADVMLKDSNEIPGLDSLTDQIIFLTVNCAVVNLHTLKQRKPSAKGECYIVCDHPKMTKFFECIAKTPGFDA